MDSFGDLKAILKLTYLILTDKWPPSIPLILLEAQDIISYEPSFKNFYLLHNLYNSTVYTPLEKSKEYIREIYDDQYKEAVIQIRY